MASKYRYADPTFEAVAAKEAKDCFGCKHKGTILGVELCLHPDKHNKKLIRCADYERLLDDRAKTAGNT